MNWTNKQTEWLTMEMCHHHTHCFGRYIFNEFSSFEFWKVFEREFFFFDCLFVCLSLVATFESRYNNATLCDVWDNSCHIHIILFKWVQFFHLTWWFLFGKTGKFIFRALIVWNLLNLVVVFVIILLWYNIFFFRFFYLVFLFAGFLGCLLDCIYFVRNV